MQYKLLEIENTSDRNINWRSIKNRKQGRIQAYQISMWWKPYTQGQLIQNGRLKIQTKTY